MHKAPAPKPKDPDSFPMRINKYLALKGHSTRKGGDELVEKRKVYINGRVAVLGDKVEATDVIEVRAAGKPKTYTYLAYNKPQGVITHSPQQGETDIQDELQGVPEAEGVFPVGRLDKDSHGLIILTNDGRITDRLLNPKYAHEKEYKVRTVEPLRDSFAKNMAAGVDIGDYVTEPCTVKREGDNTFRIILGEGKKHQIRRMVDALHNGVVDLERVRVMNIKLSGLKQGAYRKIEGEELAIFLKSLSL